MVAQAHGSADLGEGGAGGAAGGKSSGAERSTQNTQYDQIGTRYLEIKVLPAAQPEVPSILNALGENGVMGKKCLGMLIDSFSHKLYTMTLAVLHFARRVSLSSFEVSRHVSVLTTQRSEHFFIKESGRLFSCADRSWNFHFEPRPPAKREVLTRARPSMRHRQIHAPPAHARRLRCIRIRHLIHNDRRSPGYLPTLTVS